MRKILESSSALFMKLLFGNTLRYAVFRIAFAFILAFLVVFDPFCAALWFRIFLCFFCVGALLMVLRHFKFERKYTLLSFPVFAIGLFFLHTGRGDAVSGTGVALLCAVTGAALFFSDSGRPGRYELPVRVICGICAFFVSLVIITRCGQLGIRYLDQLHSYALALAGCGFANIMLIKRGDL